MIESQYIFTLSQMQVLMRTTIIRYVLDAVENLNHENIIIKIITLNYQRIELPGKDREKHILTNAINANVYLNNFGLWLKLMEVSVCVRHTFTYILYY